MYGLLASTTTVSYSTIADIVSAVTEQFSIANIVAMLSGIIGGTIAWVFLWWGVKKAYGAILGAVKSGTLSLGGRKRRR